MMNLVSTAEMPTPEAMTALCRDTLPALFGITVTTIEPGRIIATMMVEPRFLAPNGFLHAGSLVTLADTTCGIGTLCALREGANFTTVELKTNFLGTVREGQLICTATAQHLGRATQIWDAEVISRASGKRLALFRCTQMILG
ncbi:MAG: PaaI family thioesterase [Rhodospirillaceae bacterium]